MKEVRGDSTLLSQLLADDRASLTGTYILCSMCKCRKSTVEGWSSLVIDRRIPKWRSRGSYINLAVNTYVNPLSHKYYDISKVLIRVTVSDYIVLSDANVLFCVFIVSKNFNNVL